MCDSGGDLVVVVVRGGLVEEVHATAPVMVSVVDLDDEAEDIKGGTFLALPIGQAHPDIINELLDKGVI